LSSRTRAGRVGFGTVVAGSARNAPGNLLATLERRDEAAHHFEAAIAEHDREDARVAQARTLHNHSRMLLDRGREADRPRAAALLARARAIADARGLAASAAKLARLESRLRQSLS
jgi:hypothetical protein